MGAGAVLVLTGWFEAQSEDLQVAFPDAKSAFATQHLNPADEHESTPSEQVSQSWTARAAFDDRLTLADALRDGIWSLSPPMFWKSTTAKTTAATVRAAVLAR